MSQTAPSTIQDAFLASEGAKVPPMATPLAVNPQYGNVRMITPVARGSYMTMSEPRAVPGSNDPIRRYSVTLLLNPAACTDIYKAICMVADTRWPKETRPNPQNPQQMLEVSGHELLFWPKEAGGLHYPLRQGDQMYLRDPARYAVFQGLFTLNASLAEILCKGVAQRPVFVNEQGQPESPERFYSGCYVRAQLTFGAFPQPGQSIPNRGISVTLNSLQFVSDGPRLSGFDGGASAAAAFAAAGPVASSGYNPGPGFGPNAATAASVPPGVPFGFAAPATSATAAPAAEAAPASQPGMMPPAAAGGFGGGGARPPGA